MSKKKNVVSLKTVLSAIFKLFALCVTVETEKTVVGAAEIDGHRKKLEEKIRLADPPLKDHEKRDPGGSTVDQLQETAAWMRNCGARAQAQVDEAQSELEALIKAEKIKTPEELYTLSAAWRSRWGRRSPEIRIDDARVHYCKALALAGDAE